MGGRAIYLCESQVPLLVLNTLNIEQISGEFTIFLYSLSNLHSFSSILKMIFTNKIDIKNPFI